MEQDNIPDSIKRGIQRGEAPGYSAGDVALGAAAGAGGLGVSVASVKGFLGLFKQNPKAIIEAMKAAGVGAEEIAKVEALAAKNLESPSRTRRALRAIAKPFKTVMEKSSSAVRNNIGKGIKSFWKNAAAQQRYFGKTSKFIFDKASGKLIEKMTTKEIEVAAREAGKKAFQKTLERSIARRTATAVKKGAELAAKKGKDELAKQLVKNSGKVIEAEKKLAQASQKALDAAKKLDSLKAAQQGPFKARPGTLKIDKAERALKAAKQAEQKAAKSLKGISKRAVARAEKEAIKQLKDQAVKKGISKAEQEAIELAARKTATEAGERMTARVSAQLAAQGGKVANIGARTAAKAAAEKAAMSAGAQLAGQAGAGAALGAAFSVLSAAEAGYYIGKGINAFLLSQTETEEQKDRIKRGERSPKYAKDELDVYFGFYGTLCIRNVKCLGQGKPGGYSYETASSEESWTSSFFGLDYGGRNKTGLGFGKFIQVPGFNSKDILVIVGMMAALINDDIKNKKIVLNKKGDKYEVKDGAMVKPYINAFVSLAKKYPQAFGKVTSDPDGLASLSAIITYLGLQPIKIGEEEVTASDLTSRAEVERFVDGYYDALEGVGTKKQVVFGLGGQLMDKPELARKVELRFDAKYGQTWDTLRNGIDGDLDGDDYKRAIAPFLNSDKVLGPIGKEKPSPTPAGPTGPSRCDNYPITKGCVGKPVGNIIYIATYGTKTGTDLAAKNKAAIDNLESASILSDEAIKLISQILQVEAPDVLKVWQDNNFTIKSGDKVDRWLDVTASRKGMTESLDFYRKIKKDKHNKLANLLMERIK